MHNACAEGYLFRVPDVLARVRKIDRATEEIRLNDIWAYKDHCGIVVSIKDAPTGEKEKQVIAIMHCSSAERGGGERGVVTDDFQTHFKGKGDFYRI